MKYYAGIDIGGTRLKLGIIDEEGNLLVHENQPTSAIKEVLFHQIKQFIENSAYPVKGVGISAPGIIKENGYMQTSGAIKCFFQQYIKEELEAVLHLPVIIENDGKCAGMAEKWLGAAKNEENFVCLILGTAIGGAIYLDGKLRRGLGGLAGEFGVSLIGLENKNYSEQSFAYHAATVGGLCRHYSYAKKERVLDAQEIIKRAMQGDELAKTCLNDFYHAAAVLCVNTAVTIAPEKIFIGGGISENQLVMEEIKKAYQTICQEYHVLSLIEMPSVECCELHNHAGMLGAVYCLLHQ